MDYKDKLTATGEYHSGSNNWNLKHEESLIENWKQIIIQLGELYVHAKLCCWDVRTTEIYYHKATCFMKLKNRYRSLLQQKKEYTNGTQNNPSWVLCMEADIQYDILLFKTFY